MDKLDFGNINYYQMLQDQVKNLNNSWAIRFYVSMYLENGLFLYPNKSLLRNVGFDGTGVHSGFSDSFHYKNEKNLDEKIELVKKRLIKDESVV